MRKAVFAALAWLALGGAAYAQANVGAGQVVGNSSAALRPARSETVTAIFDRALSSTRGSVLRRGASGWEAVVPSATVGLPWVSAGTGADPLYQVLTVVGGGTGINLYAVGDITCATATTTLSRIADIATGNVLLSGGAGACPTYGKVTSAHITGAALTRVDDTNVTLTLGGTPASALVNAASLTLGWSGQLSIARGGTGQATRGAAITALMPGATRAGDIVYWDGSQWNTLAGNNSGTNVLQENSSGAPSWAPVRTVLTGNTSYFVATTGSDSANCTAIGTPCLTLQGALNKIIANDFNGFTVTLNIADGTYNPAGINFNMIAPQVGGGTLALVGNTGTPGNVVLTSSGDNTIVVANNANITINGVEIRSATAYGLKALTGASVTFGTAMRCGTVSAACIYALQKGTVSVGTAITVSGSMASFGRAESGGILNMNATTMTLSGTPAWGTAFVVANNLAEVDANSFTFVNTATGVRWTCLGNSVINGTGASATYFPGSTNGTASTGCQYF